MIDDMKSDSIDLSVIILTYNTCDLTRICVRSVLGDSSSYSTEIIVVDNASTDDTVSVLQKEFPSVRMVVNDRNLGFARGNNVGLELARGKFLLLLNSDTEIRPGALAALIDFMNAHTDAGACGPMLLNEDGSLQASGRELPSVWSIFVGITHSYRLWKQDFYRERNRNYNTIKRVGELSGAALLVRREMYEKLGGFDPNFFAYYEDTDWCKRIGDAGYEIYYVPNSVVIHHWRGSSQGLLDLTYRAGQDSLRHYFAKHHGVSAQMQIQVLLALKESVLIIAYLVRGDRHARQFHQRMFANIFSKLPR